MYENHHAHTSSRKRGEDLTLLGQTTYRGKTQRFGTYTEDRLRHCWIIGKTGSGKSTLLANLIAQDLEKSSGLALLDPHGSLVRQACEYIPQSRTNDVLLFDPTDNAYPISFNIFREGKKQAINPTLLTSQIISVFKKQWQDFWGPRLEHILRNGLLAVLHYEQATLITLYQFLTDSQVRERILKQVQDPIVKTFWEKEFAGYSAKLQAEATAPVLNKLGAFISHPIIRNIIGQVRSRVDIPEIMDGSGILLANLATGYIGEDAAHLLGGLLLSTIMLSASKRPVGSKPFIIYVDEFQHFVTDSIATILSESRKYGIGLVLAHQYLEQLPRNLQGAVLGNVGTIMAFRLGAQDAGVLAQEFEPHFTTQDLSNLPAYHMLIKLLADGKQLTPFLAKSLMPKQVHPQKADLAQMKQQSRMRYGQGKEKVEQSIYRSL